MTTEQLNSFLTTLTDETLKTDETYQTAMKNRDEDRDKRTEPDRETQAQGHTPRGRKTIDDSYQLALQAELVKAHTDVTREVIKKLEAAANGKTNAYSQRLNQFLGETGITTKDFTVFLTSQKEILSQKTTYWLSSLSSGKGPIQIS